MLPTANWTGAHTCPFAVDYKSMVDLVRTLGTTAAGKYREASSIIARGHTRRVCVCDLARTRTRTRTRTRALDVRDMPCRHKWHDATSFR